MPCTPHNMEEEWGFLLIDSRSAFNEINRKEMLWVIQEHASASIATDIMHSMSIMEQKESQSQFQTNKNPPYYSHAPE